MGSWLAAWTMAATPVARGAEPVFVDFSELSERERALGRAGSPQDRARVLELLFGPGGFVRDEAGCAPDDPRRVAGVSASVTWTADPPRTLSLVRQTSCQGGAYSGVAAVTEGERLIAKVDVRDAVGVVQVSAAPTGEPSAVLYSVESTQGCTFTHASVVTFGRTALAVTRDLGLVGWNDCGATGVRGEHVAVFFEGAAGALLQRNYHRSCASNAADRKDWTLLSEGPLASDGPAPR